MNFLKIAGRDLSSIFRNRFIRVSIIAIIIVPLLYSLLYLAAFWDPYSRLSDMPVAVVNLDKGYTEDGKQINYGKDLAENLKENDKIGWRFLNSLQEAEEGVKGSKYYAMFVIPEDFSKNVLSAKDSKPVNPEILYSANEKRNFLAAQINSKVLVELKAEITKNISNEYVKVTFDNLYELKDGMKKASDGSKELADGIAAAKDGSKELSDGLDKLSSSVPEMTDGVNKLSDGSTDLNAGLSKAKDGAGGLDTGMRQFTAQAVKPMSDGINSLYEGLEGKIIPGAKALKGGTNELSNGLQQAGTASAQLSEGAVSLNLAVSKQDGLKTGAAALNTAASELKGGAEQLAAGYTSLSSGIASLRDGNVQLAGGVDNLITSMNNSQTLLQKSADEDLGAYLKANPKALTDPSMQKFLQTLNTLKASTQDTKNIAQIQALQKGMHDAANGANELYIGAQAFIQGSGKLSEGSVNFAKGADMYAKGAETYADGAGKYALGANQLASGMNGAITASKQISIGASSLYEGLSNDFAGGLSKLKNSMPLALAGANQIGLGLTDLNNGIGQLYSGSGELRNGINTFKSKMPELSSGAKKLTDGAKELNEGMVKLQDGSKELNTKLTEGSDKLNKNLINSSKDMAEFISQPVNMNEKPVNPVKNYGTGFTPYFIPLSLWVGALMMFFVITDKVDSDIEATSVSIVAGKFLSYGYIGIMQSVLVSAVVLILGLRPDNMLLFFVFNIFMSFVFIAIIQSLVFLLGQVGRLLTIVLLILQLTSSAGTFPLEVVPKFFKILNPIMPFTYCTSALREIISGADYSVLMYDIAVLAVVMIVFFIISVLMKGHADKLQKRIELKKEAVNIA